MLCTKPLNKGNVYETQTSYRLAMILKVTQAKTPTALPRFKNVIYR